MSDLIKFKFEKSDVRMVNESGEVLFVGIDVAEALGYTNTRKAISDHCPHVTKRYLGVGTGQKADGSPAIQQIEYNVIPESDVYRLIFRSKLPAAQKFEDWVTKEVLPSIRKTGGYGSSGDENYPKETRHCVNQLWYRLKAELNKTLGCFIGDDQATRNAVYRSLSENGLCPEELHQHIRGMLCSALAVSLRGSLLDTVENNLRKIGR